MNKKVNMQEFTSKFYLTLETYAYVSASPAICRYVTWTILVVMPVHCMLFFVSSSSIQNAKVQRTHILIQIIPFQSSSNESVRVRDLCFINARTRAVHFVSIPCISSVKLYRCCSQN
jgi:hypothetical protein